MLSCNNCKMKESSVFFQSITLIVFLFLSPISEAATDTVLPEGTRITLQLNNTLSTKSNNEGDAFSAVVTMPVYLGNQMVIPKGSAVNGSISRILRPGRFKGKAIMNLLFQSISIPGRGQLAIVATLVRVDADGNRGIRSEGRIEGEGSTGSDAGKVVAPTIAGAGIGTLAGGGKGAGIGAGVGAAIGLATVFASRGKDIEVQRGSSLDILLDRALIIPSEGEAALK
jgi:hypothetical protein